MADYTDAEKKQLRSAAFGAVFLVTQADPGMFDMIKESFAASKVLAKAPGDMQQILKGGGMPKIPKGEKSQLEASVLADLSSSVQVISAKDPAQVDAYRQTVLDACVTAAESAGGGVQSSETEAMSKVMAALGMSGAAPTT